MNDRIGLADLVLATQWIDGDGNPAESHPDSDARLSFSRFLYLWRCGHLAVFGYRRGSTEMEELPTAWADLPAAWDVISATVSWNGISFAYLTVGSIIPSVAKRKKASEKEIKDEFAAWAASLDEYPSKPEADPWAKSKGYSTTVVRRLHKDSNPRGRGRSKQNKRQN
jgi:hypothetical protein